MYYNREYWDGVGQLEELYSWFFSLSPFKSEIEFLDAAVLSSDINPESLKYLCLQYLETIHFSAPLKLPVFIVRHLKKPRYISKCKTKKQ